MMIILADVASGQKSNGESCKRRRADELKLNIPEICNLILLKRINTIIEVRIEE